MSRSKRKTLQFIQDYKYHEVLWNHKHKYFNNKLKRREALMAIAAKYKISATLAKKKINSLRSYFCKEHQKVLNRKNGIYLSHWFAYKPLLFVENAKLPKSKATKGNNCCETEVIPETESYTVAENIDENTEDEFSIFGELIAHKIRNLDPRNRIIAQNNIQTILFDLEMNQIVTQSEETDDNVYGFLILDHNYTLI